MSLPVGVVTLAERHGGHAVTPGIYAAMVAEVAAFVDRFVAEHGRLENAYMPPGGTSGTVTTIAGVHLELGATSAARSTAAGSATTRPRA